MERIMIFPQHKPATVLQSVANEVEPHGGIWSIKHKNSRSFLPFRNSDSLGCIIKLMVHVC